MASPFTTTGRRALLAGIGAAASLVTAVVVLAIVGPGFLDFDADRRAPADAPVSGSLPFGESGTQAGVRGAAGASGAGTTGVGPGAGGASAAAPSTRPGAPRVEVRSGAGGANVADTPRPTVPGGSQPPPADPPEPGAGDRVARGLQEAGAAVGGTSEDAGSTASEHLSELNPFLGDAAQRTGSASGEGAREAGAAAGGAVRDLMPPPQTLRQPS